MRGVMLALACAVFASAGCTATLRSDGFYGCPEPDRRCPPGLVCHASDHLCYHLPETLVDSGPQPDSGPMPDTGMPMMPDTGVASMCTPACTPPAVCAIGQFAAGMPMYGCITSPAPPGHGQSCTGPAGCNMPDACMPAPGGGSMACMRPCDPHMVDSCMFGESCAMLATGTPPLAVCARPCGGTCPTGTVCDSGRGFCLPSGW